MPRRPLLLTSLVLAGVGCRASDPKTPEIAASATSTSMPVVTTAIPARAAVSFQDPDLQDAAQRVDRAWPRNGRL